MGKNFFGFDGSGETHAIGEGTSDEELRDMQGVLMYSSSR